MAHLLRRLINQIEGLTPWKFYIKTSINLPKMFRSDSVNIDTHLKFEELRTLTQEQQELESRSRKLSAQQKSLEMMVTELTRCIKQMEFDIKQLDNDEGELLDQGKSPKDGVRVDEGQRDSMPNTTSSSNK